VSGFLLDTNVLSELIKPRPDGGVVQWVAGTAEARMFLSVLTLGEIRKGIAGLPMGVRRARLESWLDEDLRARFQDRVLPIDEAVADRWGTIAAMAAAAGRPLPVIDGLLAATALDRNLTLVTRNAIQIAGTGARVLNPWR
jgi:predicted nucleic acid-binding protein